MSPLRSIALIVYTPYVFLDRRSQPCRQHHNRSICCPSADNPEASRRTYFEYISEQKLNARTIDKFVEMMRSIPKIDSGILIIAGKLTQLAKQRIDEINPIIRVEIFTEGELVVNITKHELVPKHILLSPQEKSELLKRYNIKQSQLPKIFVTDPVAKYHGLTRGDVVKIIRVSETAGKYITYRIAC